MAPALVTEDSRRQETVEDTGHGKLAGVTPLQAISQGVCLPGIPTFNSFEKQRQWMLEHMAGAFRVFARKGYTEGMSGHISVRDPEWNEGKSSSLPRLSTYLAQEHSCLFRPFVPSVLFAERRSKQQFTASSIIVLILLCQRHG